MTSFEDRLRAQLVEAVAREQERVATPRWRLPHAVRATLLRPAVLGIAAVLALAVVVLPAALRTERALAISSGAQGTSIRLLDRSATAAELTRELAAAGLPAVVRDAPASPSAVGSWLGLVESGVTKSLPQVGDNVVLPNPVGGQVELLLGVPARTGEYSYSASAFGPGEALNCSDLALSPAQEAAQRLRDRGLSIRWYELTDKGIKAAAPGTIPPGVVTGAEMQSPSTVRVYVGQSLPVRPRSADDPRFVLEGDPNVPPPDHLVIDAGRYAATTDGSRCAR